MSEPAPLWTPSPQRAAASQMHAFLERVASKHGISRDWESLRTWSVEHSDLFWPELADFAQVRFSRPATQTRAGEGMLGTKWFPGATLNYARHMLRFEGSEPAIRFVNEVGADRTITRDELRAEVARAQAALRLVGVQRGDRVAAYMPNLPETLIFMLASASLGAIWSSCSPDFGVRGVLDRFGQIEPKVLLATDGYFYSGKRFETLDRLREIQQALPGLAQTVVVPYLTGGESSDAARSANILFARMLADLPNTTTWREFLDPPDHGSPGAPGSPSHSGGRHGDTAATFDELPFDHPLFIMYSSGTTGVPKCIVHGHGGTLLQHMKELMLHTDLREGDRIFYFTTCGWMMWNWLVSGLGAGATVVLFDGNPAHPTVHTLWEMAAHLQVNVFGASPKFLSACEKASVEPGRQHDLSALRCVLSTGSPLTAEQFHWVYEHVKPDVQLSSISGGTDIISCFMLGNPLLPVYAGEIQCRGLGMDVQAWDEKQRPVIGKKGELVCASPFPSQAVGFWRDDDGSKYRGAYFDHFPGVWRHGDFIEITPHGGIIVYGRSDATLNPGGVRIGTAEIYRIVEEIPEVLDSLVVAREADDDVEIVLFVVLREDLRLEGECEHSVRPRPASAGTVDHLSIREKIRSAIAAASTRRHVPRHIVQVKAIPYTISGKKVELAVQRILHGQAVPNTDALANPEALEEYRAIRL